MKRYTHILYDCEAISRIRLQHVGHLFPSPTEIMKNPVSQISSFIRKAWDLYFIFLLEGYLSIYLRRQLMPKANRNFYIGRRRIHEDKSCLKRSTETIIIFWKYKQLVIYLNLINGYYLNLINGSCYNFIYGLSPFKLRWWFESLHIKVGSFVIKFI